MHTLSSPDHVLLAGDLMDWANLKLGQVRALVLTAAGVMAILAVLTAWWRTRSWVGTLVAFVLAALVLWGISNLSVLKTKVGSEIDDASSVSVVHVTGEGPAAPRESRRLS